jgi:hypothetical protein
VDDGGVRSLKPDVDVHHQPFRTNHMLPEIAGALLSLHANHCLLSNSGMALDLLFAMIGPKITS